jgi:hypothetical protein
MTFFNSYRTGLRAFIIKTRDGHPIGYLWAQSRLAAINRAARLAGEGATAEFFGFDFAPLIKQN